MRVDREKIHLPGGHSFRVLRWSRNLRDVESVLASGLAARITGEGMHWHYHVEMELTMFTAGEGTRFVGDHIGPFAAGDVVLLGSKLPHYWHARGPSSGLSVQWNFPHGHAFWSFPETLVFAALFQRAGRGIRYSGRTAAEIGEAFRCLVDSSGPDRLGTLFRLLAILARAPATEQIFLSKKVFSLPAAVSHQAAMADAVRYLLANFRDTIRLADILRLTRMSKPTFSRQFRKHSGKTLSDFVSNIRLQAVCRELIETDRPIIEIALSCGFGQVSFFNRIFRRIMRCSPTQFRARNHSAGKQKAACRP
jgi:AraC-like DNA-binding protein/mannose-6-phosphate isomerase-like protein (cupin superfamily)